MEADSEQSSGQHKKREAIPAADQARRTFLGHVSACKDCVQPVWGRVQLCAQGKRLERNWLSRESTRTRLAYEANSYSYSYKVAAQRARIHEREIETKRELRKAEELRARAEARLSAAEAEKARVAEEVRERVRAEWEVERRALISETTEIKQRLQLLTLDEVCALLKVSADVLRQLPLTVYRIGKRPRWSVADIEKFIASSVARPGPAPRPAPPKPHQYKAPASPKASGDELLRRAWDQASAMLAEGRYRDYLKGEARTEAKKNKGGNR